MIRLENVTKIYQNSGVATIGLHDVSIDLKKGEFVAITGESGSGKSTLLSVISQLDGFDEGTYYYNGEDITYFTDIEMDDFRKNKIGFIFQDYNIIASYTVLQNVMLPLLLKGEKKSQARQKALELIERVGLKRRVKSRAAKLSGGEKQRLAIARALALDCQILACDEPTGNLDAETSKQIIALLKEVSADKLVVIVTHNYSEVAGVATRRVKMADGKIIEDNILKEVDELEVDGELFQVNKTKKRVLFKIVSWNLINMPVKTLLTFLIFLIISVAYLFLAQLANSVIVTSDLSNSIFENNLNTSLIVYDNTQKPIDTSKLSGYEYRANSYAAQNYISVSQTNFYYSFFYEDFLNKTQIKEGRMWEADDEFVIYVAKSDYNYYKEQLTGLINEKIDFKGIKFRLVGLGTYKDSGSTNLFVSGSQRFAQICDLIACQMELKLYDSNGEYNSDFGQGDIAFSDEVTKPTYKATYIPEVLQNGGKIKLYASGAYFIDEADAVVDANAYFGTLYLPIDYAFSETYFAEVKVSMLSEKVSEEVLKSRGFATIYPASGEYNDNNSLTMILVILILVAKVVMQIQLAGYMIGFFFLTYAILSKLYKTKIADYEIFRTLGVDRKASGFILFFEGYFIELITAVIAFVGCFMLIKYALSMDFSFIILVVFMVVMFLFVLLLTRRFNKKIFKFNVKRSMLGDDEND